MRTVSSIAVPFPAGGLVESTARREQPARTCMDVQNMRAFSPTTGRSRGAQRAGLAKWCSSQVSGSNRVQDLNHATTVQTGATTQASLSIRTTTVTAVANGHIRTVSTSAVATPTGVSDPDPDLSATAPVIFSAPLFGVMYFTDGASAPKKYTVSTDTVAAWTARIPGTFPINGSDYPRLIELWRGRIVMSGIESDPHNWFMSAVGDATDYIYSPTPETETQAVSGNNAELGKVGDVVMSIVPYNDDLLLLGCDHSIWQMTGDPMSGGRLDRVSGVTGMAWGRAWCISPEGLIYFFGSRGGLYRMLPGERPERISANTIDERLSDINLDTHIVRLAWDDEGIGVRVFVTSLAGYTTSHYYYDVRNSAWWRDRFAATDHNPVAVHVYDGDDPDDRVTLAGGEDGYVRYFHEAAKSDDGSAIDSYVTIGPIQLEGGEVPFVVSGVQAILATDSDSVACDVFSLDSAEGTFRGRLLQEGGGKILLEDGTGFLLLEDADDSFSCTLSPVRSVTHNPRRRGFAAYVRLKNDTAGEGLEMESLRLSLSAIGSSKGRRL